MGSLVEVAFSVFYWSTKQEMFAYFCKYKALKRVDRLKLC